MLSAFFKAIIVGFLWDFWVILYGIFNSQRVKDWIDSGALFRFVIKVIGAIIFLGAWFVYKSVISPQL